MAQQLAQVAQLGRGDVRLGQQPGAQQMRERLGVDRVGLHPRGSDRPGAQRVREVHVIAGLLEQLGQPLPAVGRLERDMRARRVAEQLAERLAVVDDPPRERQLAVLVDDRDLRAPAVQVDADPARRVGHGRSSSRIVRPRGRNPRGLQLCGSGRRADFLPPGRRTPSGPPRAPALHDINLLGGVADVGLPSSAARSALRAALRVTAAPAIRWVAARSGTGPDGVGMVTVTCRCSARCRAGSYGVWSCQQRHTMRHQARPRVRSARGWSWPRARAWA